MIKLCWVLFTEKMGLIENGTGSLELKVSGFTFAPLQCANSPLG